MLASYACDPANSCGRLYTENQTPYRNEFERDRDRLIHSNAFRRLEYKTQVFVNHEGDHYRNRLTHSIEVASVARSVAKMLNLSDDLAEIVALAHDLGHTPFGHAGEEALNECIGHHQKFCHNAHSLKIITQLECRYARYNGLNLSWEVLEGIVKHNGPLTSNIADYILEYNQLNDLELSTYPSAEAQIASLADDIAYICHDLEDSVRAEIITLADIAELEIINQYIKVIKNEFPDISLSRLIYEATRKLIHYFINDLLTTTKDNINKTQVKDCYEIRHLGMQLVNFSTQVQQEIKNVKEFLFAKLYRHSKVQMMNNRCKKIIKGLFNLYFTNLILLPADWQQFIITGDNKKNTLLVADYIAGMTDRFAIGQYEKHYGINFNNIN